MTVFEDRQEAGRQLAALLRESPDVTGAERLVVLGIPRGGLPVAAEVAAELDAEFDVALVRKLRSPHNPEMEFGSVGSDGDIAVDRALAEELGLTADEIDAEIADRREAVQRRLGVYRAVRPAVDLEGASVVVVDDGMDTGSTARQACLLARRQGATRVLLAVPVAPRDVAESLRDVADEVLVLTAPAEFLAVDQAYRDFTELDDDAAVAALAGLPKAS